MVERGGIDPKFRARMFERQSRRWRDFVDDPKEFLDMLARYTRQDSDSLKAELKTGDRLKLLMFGLMVLSDMRKEDDPRWEWQCLPVVRAFWDKIAPLVLHKGEGDDLSDSIRRAIYERIFGEEGK